MPRRCSVKGCKSYKDKIITFSFPNDVELKQKWITSMDRPQFTPSNYSAVCLNHFTPSDLDKYHRVDGCSTKIPLKVIRLKKDAIPSVFPGKPHYTYPQTQELPSTAIDSATDKLIQSTLYGILEE
ncbi:THAP domain-containing protein 1-like [Phlebotomus papatasi]|uniref:THAP domain-containing protein 1-like n=1 Tax=Phlebotomus papatasi TaxID=29031 RepID=UPI0024836B54|nr:THAP domain-containing protein 1-like [Phlebotomus papatasi]